MATSYAEMSNKGEDQEEFFDTRSECINQQESDDDVEEDTFYDCYAKQNVDEEERENPELGLKITFNERFHSAGFIYYE